MEPKKDRDWVGSQNGNEVRLLVDKEGDLRICIRSEHLVEERSPGRLVEVRSVTAFVPRDAIADLYRHHDGNGNSADKSLQEQSAALAAANVLGFVAISEDRATELHSVISGFLNAIMPLGLSDDPDAQFAVARIRAITAALLQPKASS